MIGSDGDTDCGQYPDAGRGGDADNDAVASENYTGTEKTYARDNLADDSKVQEWFVVYAGESRKRIGAYAYKDAGPYADGFA